MLKSLFAAALGLSVLSGAANASTMDITYNGGGDPNPISTSGGPGVTNFTTNQGVATTVTFSGGAPSPSITIEGAAGAAKGHFIARTTFDYRVDLVPLSAIAQVAMRDYFQAVSDPNNTLDLLLGHAHGAYRLTGSSGSEAMVSATVGQSGGVQAECDGCDEAAIGRYNFDIYTDPSMACPPGAVCLLPSDWDGVLHMPVELQAEASIFGSPFEHIFASIDPTITIDQTFYDNVGLTAGDFALVVEPGLPGADAGGGVPEPASWALMLAGFGVVGAQLRRRRAPRPA